ncbi:MAG: hypothetical protein IT445_20950 [Phycisphaeraceae bacterium]|nr:hypothetical protein [Phycisphaeraceae bacterium]
MTLDPRTPMLHLILLLIALAGPAPGSAADQTIMPFDQVRIGMKGYGLTVFHGTNIEPFAVEVISIVSDSTPKRGTIWIRCPDERMQKSGPVQGMSGSPIYLWDEGEEGTLGQGGRLIGAFAFGYGLSKDCIVGVQPIELMRDIATRKDVKPAASSAASAGSWNAALTTLDRLRVIARQRHSNEALTGKLETLRQLLSNDRDDQSSQAAATSTDDNRAPQPLMLPLTVGPGKLAEALAPLFEPMGLRPVAGQTLAGPPPPGIDAEAVKLAPGSVLSIPLLYGDLDLSAAGTVTDVLDDGTVLGFGHPMFGFGEAALPMATGYVHFIVPSLDTSFKRVGSLHMAGSLVRDEAAGVMGADVTTFTSAPIEVTVIHPEGGRESYHYGLVNNRLLAGQLAAISVLYSVMARQETPLECTIDMQAQLNFSGGRTIAFESVLPGADILSPAFELMPPVLLMTNNPYQPLDVESIKVQVRVRDGVELANILAARIDHSEVAPGATIRVAIDILPIHGTQQTIQGQITLPADLPEGDYQLMIGGAQQYRQMKMASRPFRNKITNVDQLAQLLQENAQPPNNALYLMIQKPEGGLAVGRSEMPLLPSSRTAILASPTNNLTMPYQDLLSQQIDTDLTIMGQTNFQISVRKGAYGAKKQP